MSLQMLDLRQMKYVTLDDGRVADTLNVHALKKAMKREGHPVSEADGKQDLLFRLLEHRKDQEMASRKRHPGEAVFVSPGPEA